MECKVQTGEECISQSTSPTHCSITHAKLFNFVLHSLHTVAPTVAPAMAPVPASILLSNPVSAPQASSAGPVVGAAVGVIALLGLAWFRVQKKRREPKRVRVYSAPAPVDDVGQAPADMPADAPGPQNPTQSPVQPVSSPVFIAGPIAVDPVTQGTFSVRPSVDVDVAGAAGAPVVAPSLFIPHHSPPRVRRHRRYHTAKPMTRHLW